MGPELRHKIANPGVTAQQTRHGDALTGIALKSSLASSQGMNNAGKTCPPSSTPPLRSVNFVSGSSPPESDLHAFQDLLSSGSDHHLASSRAPPRSSSERASVIRLIAGKVTNWPPDVDVYAVGSDEANVVNFVAKLDTAADICIMAEKTAARFGIDQIDRSDQPDIQGLAEKGIKSMGRIEVDFHLALETQWYGGSFYVISDLVIQDRFDALLSREAIPQMNLLLLGPTLKGQTVQNGSSRCQQCDHATIARDASV